MTFFHIASFSAILLSLIILCIFHVLPTGGSTALSFSVKLIHRDNPESPVYDPTSTPLSRIRATIQRSLALANYFNNTSASAKSSSRHLAAIDGESFFLDGMGYHGTYLVELGIGEPRQPAHFGISTYEGMSFVMCKHNENYDVKDAPFFDPMASTTYSTIPCLSNSCNSMRRFPCNFAENRICKYEDHPHGRYLIINGILSNETVHLQNSAGGVSVPGILLGCTHTIKIKPNDGTSDRNRKGIGIIGLNNHALSFLNQLHYATNGKLSRKLSYCLSILGNEVSRLYLGYTPPFDAGSNTTPLYISTFGNTYSLQLEGMVVLFRGEVPVHISVNLRPQNSNGGNMLMDSSSPITYITELEMRKVIDVVVSRMQHRQQVQVPEGLDEAIKLCYDWQHKDPQNLPKIGLEFKNGAIMYSRNFFSVVTKDVICLVLASADRFTNGIRILGTGPQLGYRIAIDLEKKEMKFKPDNCKSRESN